MQTKKRSIWVICEHFLALHNAVMGPLTIFEIGSSQKLSQGHWLSKLVAYGTRRASVTAVTMTVAGRSKIGLMSPGKVA